jgi:hypothetical protein
MSVHEELLRLGEQAATLLGYFRLGSTALGWTAYEPPERGKLRKDQVPPRISVGNITIMLQQPDYRVTWYVITRDAHAPREVVCGISGRVTNDVLARVLEAWDNPELRTAYDQKAAWYDANPMYRQPVKTAMPAQRQLAPREDVPRKRV